MKKFISLILVAVLLMLAIPTYVFATETDADTNTDTNTGDTNNESTVPTQTWAEAGKYDLSWAEDLITEEIQFDSNGNPLSVVVDNKIYTCKYVTATYEIDTLEKLVGVAVLANAFCPIEDAEGNVTYKGVESFSGATFKLTAPEYDLSEYLWDPIANSWSHKFRGHLISDEGTVIKGMTIRSTEANHQLCFGLIGMHGDGSIKNITLEGATIEVASGATGSFVGYENFCGADAVYENLKSDAVIKHELPIDETTGLYDTTAGHSAWCGVGGILGTHNNTKDGRNLEIISCVFTGSIDAPTSAALGGIVGLDRTAKNETITISKCVVVSDTLRWGVARPGGPKAWYCGMGGIIGVRIVGGVGYMTLSECYVSVNNFIVEEDEQVAHRGETPDTPIPHEGVGGMIGNHDTITTLSNCQVDFSSMSGDTSSHHGAFSGRQMARVIFNNCVNTGIWGRIKGASWGNANTFAWSARAQDLDMDGCVNFSAIQERYGWDYTDQLPTPITSVDTWKETLNSAIWSEREGSMYPILTIAKDYVNYSMANDDSDFSFFNMGANSYVATNEQLKGLSHLIDVQGEYGGAEYLMDTKKAYAKKITINPDLVDADFESFSETSRDLICTKMGFIYGAVLDSSKISIEFAQVALQPNEDIKESKNNTFDIRVVAKIDCGSYKSVSFTGTRTLDGESIQYVSPDIKICYKTLIEVVDGEAKEISAGDGYFVCFTIKDVDLKNVEDIKLSFRAYATDSDGTIYYSGKYVEIPIVPFI